MTAGNIPVPIPVTEWFTDGAALRRSGHLGTYTIRGVCYSRALIGETPSPTTDYIGRDRAEIWKRDLARMRAMGVNAIKIYSMDVSGPPVDGLDSVAVRTSRNQHHEDFLDAAWNGGDRPISVILSLWVEPLLLGLREPATAATSAATSADEMQVQVDAWRKATGRENYAEALAALRTDYRTLARCYAAHAAVLGFSIGAEVNVEKSLAHVPAFWDDFVSIAATVRAELTASGSRKIITTGLIDGTTDVTIFEKTSDVAVTDVHHRPIAVPPTTVAPPNGFRLRRVVPAALRMALDAQGRASAAAGSAPIDVWGFDVYQHHSQYLPVFDRYTAEFTRRGSASAPLFIAEFGEPASRHDGTTCDSPAQRYPRALERNAAGMAMLSEQLINTWSAIESRVAPMLRDSGTDPRVGCGGCIFEWADEWWKGDEPDARVPSMHNGHRAEMSYKSSASGTIHADEKWFGLHALVESHCGRSLRQRRTYADFQERWAPRTVNAPISSAVTDVGVSGWAPSFLEHGGRVWAVFANRKDGKHNVTLVRVDGSRTISISGTSTFESPAAISACGGTLLAWHGLDSSDLYTGFTKDLLADNPVVEREKVSGASIVGWTAPALLSFRDRFLLIWVDAGDKTIRYQSYDPRTGSKIGDASAVRGATTMHSPACAVVDGQLWVVWTGLFEGQVMYWNRSDDALAWDIPSATSVASTRGPALATFDGVPYLFWKALNDDRVDGAMYRSGAWTSPQRVPVADFWSHQDVRAMTSADNCLYVGVNTNWKARFIKAGRLEECDPG